MIYITGDIHGDVKRIKMFSEYYELKENDIIIILGDVGVNYYHDSRDRKNKKILSQLKPTIFCIHGNHERRPISLPTYIKKEYHGGTVWYEEEYPNILTR